MTAVHSPMITELVDPVATATAVSGLCAASVAVLTELHSAAARAELAPLVPRRQPTVRRGLPTIARAFSLAGATATLAFAVFHSP